MEFTNRATKTYYNNFIKAVEKIETINMIEKPAAYKSQLSQLEINLKNIKKFEPNLDISELESQFNFFKNAISSSDNQKSIEKDLLVINKTFEVLFTKLNETKLNFDNIDLQVRLATEPIERDIKIFKSKYQEYDTTTFSNKVEEFQKKFKSKLENANNENSSKIDIYKDYEKMIKKPHFSIWTLYPDYQKPDNLYEDLYQYIPEDIIAFEKILENYKVGFDNFLMTHNSDLINIQNQDNSNSRNFDMQDTNDLKASSIVNEHINKISVNRAKDLIVEINEHTTKFEVDKYFNNLAEAYYWIGLAKLHPNQNQIVAFANQFQEMVNVYGTIEDYQSKIRENGKKIAKKVFMPKAFQSNAELEEISKKAFEAKGWNEIVLKVNILANDWRLERRDLVLGRVLDVAIASKKQDGDCLLYRASIRQEFAGDDNYAQAYLYSYTNTYIAEENIV